MKVDMQRVRMNSDFCGTKLTFCYMEMSLRKASTVF